MKLHIDETVKPVAQPHRRIPFHVRKQLERQLDREEENDVIEKLEGPTPLVSPVAVAPKPKQPGSTRMCVDMRLRPTRQFNENDISRLLLQRSSPI